jgi:hypothetical protein
MSAPRTLIRATPSLAAAKTLPSLPSASAAYAPVVQAALAARLRRRVLLPSAALALAVACAWVRVRPATLALGGALWLAAVVPVVVLRKRAVGLPRAPRPSPRATATQALARPDAPRAAATYALSALALLALHCALAPQDAKIAVLGGSKCVRLGGCACAAADAGAENTRCI